MIKAQEIPGQQIDFENLATVFPDYPAPERAKADYEKTVELQIQEAHFLSEIFLD